MKITWYGIVLILVFVGLVSPTAFSQRVFTYPVVKPHLTYTPAINGSKVTIMLRDAPAGSVVWWSFSLYEEDAQDPGFQDSRYRFSAAEDRLQSNELWENNPWAEVGTADVHGRAYFEIPLQDPDWAGRTVLVKALVQDPKTPDHSNRLPLLFTVRNPEIYLPTFTSPEVGGISKYDEVQGDLIAQIQGIYGIPEKVIFTRDARMGFAMLDGDRIAVIDNHANRAVYPMQTGHGLMDIALTPDGKKLIAVTKGVKSPTQEGLPPGQLWIYDTDNLFTPDWLSIYPLGLEGKGRLLAVSEDSTQVIIRQAGLFVGTYNLLFDLYQPVHLGEGCLYHRGEIQDLRIYGNCLLTLVTLPNGDSHLLGMNLQNYERFFSFEVGKDVEGFKLLSKEGLLPRVALLDRSDEREDRLRLVDVFSDMDHSSIALPDNVLDFDALESLGLCMIVHRDPAEGKGLVRFIDLKALELLPQTLTIDLNSDARVYLSRSQGLHSGYIYSDDGSLFEIDLDLFRVTDRIKLPGGCSAPVVEIY
ncbi:MAG: hypothetical protein KJ645_08840 [Planctomycetes bacterium]|nr:hypothetical protein [Planctomycetota bacterium]